MPNDDASESTYDLVSTGELLADLISEQPVDDLASATHFRRFTGGSASNLARNLAVMGHSVALIATVGRDSLGRALTRELVESGVDTTCVSRDDEEPTSTALIARGQQTPDFLHYRGADARIDAAQFGAEQVEDCSVYHTTGMALGTPETRDAVLAGAERASEAGARLSIDANYARCHGSDASTVRDALRLYCRERAYVKLSLDDVERLFEVPGDAAPSVITRLHDWGAELVSLTRGDRGSLVSWDEGARSARIDAVAVDAFHGATGAGDAYWAGFLSARFAGTSPEDCAEYAAHVAARQIGQPGHLTAADLPPIPAANDPH